MRENMIQAAFAERIGGQGFGRDTRMYKFEMIKQAKRQALQANPDIELIDLGVGEPDAMADPAVVRILQDEAAKPENRFYADNGILTFKRAAAAYMREEFGVADLDPETEIIPVVGSKSALAMLPAAFINPGDVILMPSRAIRYWRRPGPITVAALFLCRCMKNRASCRT